jgi:hypothetical protein
MKESPNEVHALAKVVAEMLMGVERFSTEIVALPIPEKPTVVKGARLEWARTALTEELEEFLEASLRGDVVGAADGLVDLIYFALGRLIEMGVPPIAVFDEVQAANMQKVKGEWAKRPGSMGYDAVKPPNWMPPNLDWLLGVRRPARTQPGSLKKNDGKPRLSLVPAEAVEGEARVFEHSAEGKYDYWDWLRGRSWSDLVDAMGRHLAAFASGEDHDRDTGLSHMAHIRCNAAMLMVYDNLHPEHDDRRHKYDTA